MRVFSIFPRDVMGMRYSIHIRQRTNRHFVRTLICRLTLTTRRTLQRDVNALPTLAGRDITIHRFPNTVPYFRWSRRTECSTQTNESSSLTNVRCPMLLWGKRLKVIATSIQTEGVAIKPASLASPLISFTEPRHTGL